MINPAAVRSPSLGFKGGIIPDFNRLVPKESHPNGRKNMKPDFPKTFFTMTPYYSSEILVLRSKEVKLAEFVCFTADDHRKRSNMVFMLNPRWRPNRCMSRDGF